MSDLTTIRDLAGLGNEASAISDSALVIIDAQWATGLEVDQLSEFIAMLALSGTNIDQPVTPARTILNLPYDEERSIAGATAWDRSYLQGLYSTDGDRRASTQRGQIAAYMRRSLAGE